MVRVTPSPALSSDPRVARDRHMWVLRAVRAQETDQSAALGGGRALGMLCQYQGWMPGRASLTGHVGAE